MDVKQLITINHFHSNVYQLPIDVTKASSEKRSVDFKKLVSKKIRHGKIQAYLLQETRESESFARSNKAIRKIENMIDVINFSLFDFELMHERYQDDKLLRLLEDIIAILKSTKKTISQAVIEGLVVFKSCGDAYMMGIYAAIETINHLMAIKSIVSEKLLDNLENMKTSLIYAVDEHLGS